MQEQQDSTVKLFNAKEDDLADLTHAAKVERQTLQNALAGKQAAVELAEVNLGELESDKRTLVSELQQAELRAEEMKLTHERRMASLDAQTEVLSRELADREMHEEQMREMHAQHEAEATVQTGRFDELTAASALKEESLGNLKTQLAALEVERDALISQQGKLAALLQESANEEYRLTGQKNHSQQVRVCCARACVARSRSRSLLPTLSYPLSPSLPPSLPLPPGRVQADGDPRRAPDGAEAPHIGGGGLRPPGEGAHVEACGAPELGAQFQGLRGQGVGGQPPRGGTARRGACQRRSLARGSCRDQGHEG
jgi:hypothetical protein